MVQRSIQRGVPKHWKVRNLTIFLFRNLAPNLFVLFIAFNIFGIEAVQ
jgi:hypothetical protein